MRRLSFLAFLWMVVTVLAAHADSRADEIMQRSYALPQASTMQATVYMLLVDQNGTQNLRVLAMVTRKRAGGTDSYVDFLSPADVKGTKFLSLAVESGGDVQRIWLPELGKVRRIAGSGKGDRFVGSDLTYYDMSPHHFSEARYSLQGEARVEVTRAGSRGSVDCWVIDSTPVDPSVPYTRVRLLVGKEDSFIYRSTMWDARGNEIKSIYILETQERQGIIVPIRTGVVAADGHKTLLQMNDVRLDAAVDPALFTVANLER